MSVNVRKGKHYTDLNYEWLKKGWDVSAVSFHKLMQSLFKLDAMNEWGSIVALTYIAAQGHSQIIMIWLITRLIWNQLQEVLDISLVKKRMYV